MCALLVDLVVEKFHMNGSCYWYSLFSERDACYVARFCLSSL